MNKKRGFTLPEILFAVMILGIVATIVIPAVISSYNKSAIISSLKQANIILITSYEKLSNNVGSPMAWKLDVADPDKMLEPFRQNILIKKTCSNAKECYGNASMKFLNGLTDTDFATSPKLMLAQNIILSPKVLSEDCSIVFASNRPYNRVCGILGVDVNAAKGPNTYGYDYFEFFLTAEGIVPTGVEYLNASASEYSINNCNIGGTGRGCANWVLTRDNIDYLEKRKDD